MQHFTSLRKVGECPSYSVRTTIFDTDFWGRRTIKLFSRETYDALQGLTRRGKGTMGVVDQIKLYDRPVLKFEDYPREAQPLLIRAAVETAQAFRLERKIHPLDFHEVSSHMNLDTSAGWSFPGAKKRDVLPQLYQEVRWLAHRMKQGGKEFNPASVQMPPSMAARRGKLTEVGQEVDRLVWVYPAEMLGIEGIYAVPLIRAYEALGPKNPMLQGKNLDQTIIDWLRRRGQEKFYLALDISQFDQTVQPWFIRQAFDILKQNIEWATWYGKPVSPAQQRRWSNVWKTLEWYFINTPMAAPDGVLYRKSLGVPSGSWFTQLVDSIVNFMYVKFASLYLGFKVLSLKVLGDDSAAKTSTLADVGQISDLFRSVLQVEVNVAKSIATDDPTQVKLLGFTYGGLERNREFLKWMESFLYPDTDVWSAGESFGRLIGLLLAGGINNPLFCKFFTFFQTCWDLSGGPVFTPATLRALRYASGVSIDPSTVRSLWLFASLR